MHVTVAGSRRLGIAKVETARSSLDATVFDHFPSRRSRSACSTALPSEPRSLFPFYLPLVRLPLYVRSRKRPAPPRLTLPRAALSPPRAGLECVLQCPSLIRLTDNKMKFSVTACILALSMLSTAQAACHRRSRRSYGEALIPSSAGVARALPEPKVIKPVVRRHKGGRRMDLERRADAVRESWAQRAHHDSLSGPSSAASVTGESSSSGGDISSTTTTSTSYEAATGSTNAAAASATASSSSSSSSSSGTYSGQATFFYRKLLFSSTSS
jgi:hypothetical protein